MSKVGMHLRKRHQLYVNNEYEVFEKFKYYNCSEIAILSIGIWNGHSCYSATERIHELAPKANMFIKKMRNMGCHIIHGGSYSNYHCEHGNWDDTMLRKNIAGKPVCVLKDKGLYVPELPIDDSDGGYDPIDKNKEYNKSSVSIHPSIDIDYEKDCISNYSKEILNYLFDKNIKCLLVFGTHTNMCLLDKPYGIKWYIRYGFPVVVVRDLCDAMYNINTKPTNDIRTHHDANETMIEWIEKYISPTINSNEILQVNKEKKTIIVDIDNTITTGTGYEECKPNETNINKINLLYDKGHNIIYWTSRGVISDNNWYEHTSKQLKLWNVKYTLLVTKKPYYDVFIDDKTINLINNEDYLNLIRDYNL